MNIERGHAVIERKVLDVARTGAIPIVLGGDHSITFPSATAVARASRPAGWASSISTRTPMPPMRPGEPAVARRPDAPAHRVGAVAGRNFVQIGLRGYWPGPETLEWMREQGMRWHLMTEIEERGAEAVVPTRSPRRSTDRRSSTSRSTSTSSIRLGAGHRHPGARGDADPALRAIRQVVGAVELAGWTSSRWRPPTTMQR